jgi:hypothetical protein
MNQLTKFEKFSAPIKKTTSQDSIYVSRGGSLFHYTLPNGEVDHDRIRSARAHLANICVRIPYKGYEISISCDDSAGCCAELVRSDIRIYQGNVDMTVKVMKENHIYADATMLRQAMDNIDALEGE